MTPHQQKEYRAIGGRLAVVLRQHDGQLPTPATMQAIVADLVGASTELLPPMKDLVSRPGFQQLSAKAGSGSGAVERRALLADLEMTFTPAVIDALEELLGGFLDLPIANPSAEEQGRAESPSLPGVQATATTRHEQPSVQRSPRFSAQPPQPPPPRITEVFAPQHPPTRRINPIALALGGCLAAASVVVAGIAAMRSPSLCTSLGLCPRHSESTTAQQMLNEARRAVGDLKRASSLVRYRRASVELERALQGIEGTQDVLTPEQQQQREMLGSFLRKAKAAILQDEADMERLRRAEMALAASRQGVGSEQQKLIRVAIEALQSIAAGGFAGTEATRLQKEIDRFQLDQTSVPGERVEQERPTASSLPALSLDEPPAENNPPVEERPPRPAPKPNSEGEWRVRPLF